MALVQVDWAFGSPGASLASSLKVAVSGSCFCSPSTERGGKALSSHHAGDALAEDDVHLRDTVRPCDLVLHHLGLPPPPPPPPLAQLCSLAALSAQLNPAHRRRQTHPDTTAPHSRASCKSGKEEVKRRFARAKIEIEDRADE